MMQHRYGIIRTVNFTLLPASIPTGQYCVDQDMADLLDTIARDQLRLSVLYIYV